MKTTTNIVIFILILGFFTYPAHANKSKRKLQFLPNSVELAPGENVFVILHYNHINFLDNETITLTSKHKEVADVKPDLINLKNAGNNSQSISITAHEAGYTTIGALVHKKSKGGAYVELRVFVAKSSVLRSSSMIFGWLYALAWSASFYPKIYDNYVRKNVFGLNHDCIVLNVVGFAFYALYNTAFYFLPSLQDEYASRYSADILPVELNDVVFSIHSLIASLVVAFQCFWYRDPEYQFKASSSVIIAFLLLSIKLVICGVLAYKTLLHWLDVISFASLITLIASIGKFLIQGLMTETKHQSIVGWPIEDIFVGVHFVGGVFCVLQVIINGFNYHDYNIIFGNLTKLLLGLLVINYDLVCFYKLYQSYKNNGSPYAYIQREHPHVIDAVEQDAANSSVGNIVRRNDPRNVKNPIIFTGANPVNQPLVD